MARVNVDDNVDLSFAAINPEAMGINESTLHVGQTNPAKKQNMSYTGIGRHI